MLSRVVEEGGRRKLMGGRGDKLSCSVREGVASRVVKRMEG